MPKKSVRNNFYFYMLDYRKKQEVDGRRFANLKEVSDAAGPSWNELKPSERQRYDQIARDYKNTPGKIKKFTSQGEPIELVDQRIKEANDLDMMERDHVRSIVNQCDASDTLREKLFYLIDVNYYCETKELFVINEVSLVSFSLEQGINRIMHTVVDPVHIPAGYASSAKESFDEHQFSLPPLEMGESDMLKVLTDMMEFLQLDEPDMKAGCWPPMFTLDSSDKPSSKVKAVKSFLEQACGTYEDPNIFPVYRLQILFHVLSQTLKNGPNEGLPTEALALFQLQKDPFQYTAGHGCKFHEETDKYYNCTRARVRRWAYTMLDSLCPLANVEMVAGYHLPDDINVEAASKVKEQWEEERDQRAKSSQAFTFIGPSDDQVSEYSVPPHRSRPPPLRQMYEPDLNPEFFPTLGGPVPRASKRDLAHASPAPMHKAGPSGRPPGNPWNRSTPTAFAPEPPNPWNKVAAPVARKPGDLKEGEDHKRRDVMRRPVSEFSSNDQIGAGRGRGRGMGDMYF